MRTALPLLALTLIAGSLAGCDKRAPTAPPSPSAHIGARAAPPTVDLAAAAEPFEALTETAFTSKPAELDAAVATAMTAAAASEAHLKFADWTTVQKQMAAIADARRLDQRADIALASIDIYRVMVSAGSRRAIDKQVSLLDYAGFRFDADLKASPPRWKDAADAAAFGQAHWQTITTVITDTALQIRMSRALSDMADSARNQNAAAASAAAKRELDLVDSLEAFVAQPR